MKPKNIRQLVQLALSDNNTQQIIIGKMSIKQSKIVEGFTGLKLVGTSRIMDTSMIRHTLKNHGSIISESKRGQEAVNIDDFEKIPLVLKEPDAISYKGLNGRKQHLFEYKKWIGINYFVVEAVRVSKKNALVFTTMYKRKRKKNTAPCKSVLTLF